MLRAGICDALTHEVYVKLKERKINNVVDFLNANSEELARKTSIPYKDLHSIRRVLTAQHAAFPVRGDVVFTSVLSGSSILSTGLKSLDELLDGGLYTSQLTELCGAAGAGKSQICMNVAVKIAQDLKKNVLYVDTSGQFDAAALQTVLLNRDVDESEAVEFCARIRCVHSYDINQLLSDLSSIQDHLTKKDESFYESVQLIVVDCIASVISPVLGGKQYEGHSYMMQAANLLKNIAADHNVAVLITNTMTRTLDGEKKPSLGASWLSVPHCRIQLHQRESTATLTAQAVQSSQRIAILTKSTSQATGRRATFHITDSGPQDVSSEVPCRTAVQ